MFCTEYPRLGVRSRPSCCSEAYYSHDIQALDISMGLLGLLKVMLVNARVLHSQLDNGPSKGHCHSISYHVSLLVLLSVFHLPTLLDQFSDMTANL
jgi:hypothetical protein